MKISNGVNKKISFPIAIIIIAACAVLVGVIVVWQYKFFPEIPWGKTSFPKKIADECVIREPDLNGYLLKICKYLREHKDTIIPNKEPDNYSIESIKEGQYSRFEGGEYKVTDVLVIRLDCCYTGDLAYVDKETNEVIGFSSGDL